MKTIRFTDEKERLMGEAEDRARNGEKLSVIAADLGVPLSTISDWARRGGWSRAMLAEQQANDFAQMYHRIRMSRRRARLETKSAEPPGNPAFADDRTEGAPDDEFDFVPPPEERPLPEFMCITMAEMLLERGQFDAAEKLARLASRFYDFRSKALFMTKE